MAAGGGALRARPLSARLTLEQEDAVRVVHPLAAPGDVVKISAITGWYADTWVGAPAGPVSQLRG